MNNNRHFDENIKEQFSNYAPDVHPRIWENIISEKNNRKPAGFWLSFFNSRNLLILLGILLAGGSGAWLLVRNSSPNNQAVNHSPAKNQKDNPGSPNSSQVNTIINSNGDNGIGETTVSTAINKNNTNTLTGPVFKTNQSIPATKANIYIHSPADQAANDASLTADKKTFRVPGNPSGKYNNNNTDPEISFTGNSTSGGSLLGRLFYEAGKIANRVTARSELQKRTVPSWLLPDCPSMEKDAAGNKKYIEIYGGPDLIFRQMSDTGNSVYLQKRKESTKSSSAFSAGIRYTRVFSNSMSVRTGVSYSQMNEKFTFVQGNLVQVTYIIDVNGDTTGSYVTTGTRYKTTHNKYRSIDVPLMLGYEVGNGKLHANINVGPVINIYSWQKGEVLDTALRPVSITTGKGSSPYQFKTNAGVGFMAAVSLYYKLNEKIHVMAEPYFRYNLSQLNKENLTLKQKYSSAGLRLGVRVDLK